MINCKHAVLFLTLAIFYNNGINASENNDFGTSWTLIKELQKKKIVELRISEADLDQNLKRGKVYNPNFKEDGWKNLIPQTSRENILKKLVADETSDATLRKSINEIGITRKELEKILLRNHPLAGSAVEAIRELIREKSSYDYLVHLSTEGTRTLSSDDKKVLLGVFNRSKQIIEQYLTIMREEGAFHQRIKAKKVYLDSAVRGGMFPPNPAAFARMWEYIDRIEK